MDIILLTALLGGAGVLIRNWMKNQEIKNKEQDLAIEAMKSNYISRFEELKQQNAEIEKKVIEHFGQLMLAIEKVNASVQAQNELCRLVQENKRLNKQLANSV